VSKAVKQTGRSNVLLQLERQPASGAGISLTERIRQSKEEDKATDVASTKADELPSPSTAAAAALSESSMAKPDANSIKIKGSDSVDDPIAALSSQGYGFNDGYEGVLERLAPHELVAMVLLDPDRAPGTLTGSQRMDMLDKDTAERFDPIRLVVDAASADEDMIFLQALEMTAPWDKQFARRKAWTKQQRSQAAASAASSASSTKEEQAVPSSAPSGSAVQSPGDLADPGKSSDTGKSADHSGTAGTVVDPDAWFEGFSREEKAKLLTLPNRKEFLIAPGSDAELRAASDILCLLYAYCHEYRSTGGDPGPESARTLVEMIPQLGFLVHAKSMEDALKMSMQRALLVPYMRCWRLARLIARDATRILACGRPSIVQCLLGLREMLNQDAGRSRHAQLWVDDAIVWVQRTSAAMWSERAKELRAAVGSSSPSWIGSAFHLPDIEEAARMLVHGEAEDPPSALEAALSRATGRAEPSE